MSNNNESRSVLEAYLKLIYETLCEKAGVTPVQVD